MKNFTAETFDGLVKLWYLHLEDNGLNMIWPEAFVMMDELWRLYLSKNCLRSLGTKSFSGLNDLDELYLNFNLISDIEHGTFSHLNRLEILHLGNNYIQNITKEMFTGLGWLEEIVLSHNRINTIGDHIFADFDFLKIVDLGFNKISFISGTMFSGSKIKKLLLNNNEISRIDSNAFISMIYLEELLLSHNNLQIISEDSFLINKDIRLSIDFNPLDCNSSLCWLLRAVDRWITLQAKHLTTCNKGRTWHSLTESQLKCNVTKVAIPSHAICDNGTTGSGRCFWAHLEQGNKQTFAEARAICQAEGGDLATLETIMLWKFVQINFKIMFDGSQKAWLGLHHNGHESIFRWLSGHPLYYESWEQGQPQSPSLHCVGIKKTGSVLSWSAISCGYHEHFICSNNATEFCLKPENGCFLHPSGPQEDEFSPSTLSDLQPAANWWKAKQTCEEMGMKLLITPTLEKDNMFQSYVEDLGLHEDIWLGASDFAVESVHRWLDGHIFTWTKWSRNPVHVQPKGKKGDGKHCVIRQRHSTYDHFHGWQYDVEWENVDCNHWYKFFCEHIPEVCEINGNMYLNDKNENTCVTMQIDGMEISPLVTVTKPCIKENHTFILYLKLGMNDSCGELERRISIKKDSTGCENSVRLVPCVLLNQTSQGHCRFECVCHSDPCLTVLALSNRNTVNNKVRICESWVD